MFAAPLWLPQVCHFPAVRIAFHETMNVVAIVRLQRHAQLFVQLRLSIDITRYHMYLGLLLYSVSRFGALRFNRQHAQQRDCSKPFTQHDCDYL